MTDYCRYDFSKFVRNIRRKPLKLFLLCTLNFSWLKKCNLCALFQRHKKSISVHCEIKILNTDKANSFFHKFCFEARLIFVLALILWLNTSGALILKSQFQGTYFGQSHSPMRIIKRPMHKIQMVLHIWLIISSFSRT